MIYLFISVVSAIILPFSLAKYDGNLSALGNSLLNIWLPFWILVLSLPFYGIIQITKLTDEIPIKLWIGLLINLISFILILRFFSIEILPS
ncbi:MAG: hypothetical protein R2790_05430 [Flavobacterium haoranii]